MHFDRCLWMSWTLSFDLADKFRSCSPDFSLGSLHGTTHERNLIQPFHTFTPGCCGITTTRKLSVRTAELSVHHISDTREGELVHANLHLST